MNRKPCDSDLTDEQWSVIEPALPPAKPRGRSRANLREVLNAVMYAARRLLLAHAPARPAAVADRPQTLQPEIWIRTAMIHLTLRRLTA